MMVHGHDYFHIHRVGVLRQSDIMAICKLLLLIFCLPRTMCTMTDLLERVPGVKYLALDYLTTVNGLGPECELNKSFDKEYRSTYKFQVYRDRARKQLFRFNLNVPRDVSHVSVILRISLWSGLAYNTLFEQQGGICEQQQTMLQHTFRIIKLKIAPGCILKAGNYTVEDMNIDQYTHNYMKKMLPGRAKINFEFYSPKGRLWCMRSLVTFSQPQKQKGISG